jgi:hypothetical protein
MSKITLRKHLDAYRETPEQWKSDHDMAMLCYDVQDSIAVGLLILKWLDELDELVTAKSLRKETPEEESKKMCADVEILYREWEKASLDHLDFVVMLRQKGFRVDRADELEEAIRTVRKMLTPDQDFFTDSKLVAARDSAMDAHVGGETTEWTAN